MMVETPFQISIPESQLSLLHQKLDLNVFPDELENAGRAYGASLTDIRRLVARWKSGYDWRKHEAQLNADLPQFTRDIDVEGFGTLNIHYVHKQSEIVGAVPLLFVHGWPGSFIEVRKILPLLVEASPDHPSFHVVALSLPGYGFSSAPTKKGFRLAHYAEVAHKLMLALGYNQYVTQGGDWGYHITRTMALQYGGKHSKALHTNYLRGATPPEFLRQPFQYLSHLFTSYTPRENAGLERSSWFGARGRGYHDVQATQPQTLGYALADSPVGLLAWIYEKLVAWTDDYPWSDDEVLTWTSVYLFSRAGPAAAQVIYYEVVKGKENETARVEDVTIPVGVSCFPKDIYVPPRSWLRFKNLVFESEHDRGGHFAAYERPEDLASDLRTMFGRGGGAFGVVLGKSGYA